jgi:nucleoside 2-deoxyribosyltransferase
MRVFLAGIMQGSHVAALVHDQNYRAGLRDVVQRRWPEAEVYDPHAGHANSVGYSLERAREVFDGHVAMCREFDLVIAFVPEASMGTAIEIWEACRHGRAVITITPLVHNWVVQLTSLAVYRDREAFEAALTGGEIDRLLLRHAAGRQA